jgi:hypothetical protein
VKVPVALLLLCATALAQKGVALGLFAEDPGFSYRPLLGEIAALGADHVELVVAFYQKDVAAVEVGDHPRFTAPESAVRRAIRDAHRAGLEVLLFPIVRLETQHHPDEWRGTLRPRDRAAWFASYGRKLLSLAQLAKEEHVESLSVGSELSTLDGDLAAWMAVIAAVRARFSGRLVYSGNWDHYRDVAIYPLVDDLGLCGYFALAEPDLARAWSELRAQLREFAQGRRILFTEVGYLSQRGAAAWPWDEGATGAVDLEEQRRCYAAFCRTWSKAPELAGVYFWNWYGWGGPTSRGYTPRGKPAAEEIRAFFH